ncbi:hypothetical protein BC629DRAFT_192054 [Irpex lacteus]|nr:hypothetical protein BC629DRAFT_192054 [Irpex lacteus]
MNRSVRSSLARAGQNYRCEVECICVLSRMTCNDTDSCILGHACIFSHIMPHAIYSHANITVRACTTTCALLYHSTDCWKGLHLHLVGNVTDDQRSSEVAGQANFDQVLNSGSSRCMLSDCATMGTAYFLYWKKERNILSFYTLMACQSFCDRTASTQSEYSASSTPRYTNSSRLRRAAVLKRVTRVLSYTTSILNIRI